MKERLNKGRGYCLAAAILIIVSYVSQRLLNNTLEQTRHLVLAEAFVFTAITIVVFYLIAKSKETYYGILMALFGIRMLPIEIPNLAEFSRLGNLLYFFVEKAAVIIFLLIIALLFKQQKEPRQIKLVPILSIIFIVPFFNEIMSELYTYLAIIGNGNLMMAYFSNYIVYAMALIALLFVAVKSNEHGINLICDFQIIALAINMGKRIVAVAINHIHHTHISSSYYGWIILNIVFMVGFFYVKRNVKKDTIEKA